MHFWNNILLWIYIDSRSFDLCCFLFAYRPYILSAFKRGKKMVDMALPGLRDKCVLDQSLSSCWKVKGRIYIRFFSRLNIKGGIPLCKMLRRTLKTNKERKKVSRSFSFRLLSTLYLSRKKKTCLCCYSIRTSADDAVPRFQLCVPN